MKLRVGCKDQKSLRHFWVFPEYQLLSAKVALIVQSPPITKYIGKQKNFQ